MNKIIFHDDYINKIKLADKQHLGRIQNNLKEVEMYTLNTIDYELEYLRDKILNYIKNLIDTAKNEMASSPTFKNNLLTKINSFQDDLKSISPLTTTEYQKELEYFTKEIDRIKNK